MTTTLNNSYLVKVSTQGEGGQNCQEFCQRGLYTPPYCIQEKKADTTMLNEEISSTIGNLKYEIVSSSNIHFKYDQKSERFVFAFQGKKADITLLKDEIFNIKSDGIVELKSQIVSLNLDFRL